MGETVQLLIKRALENRQKSYCPYSDYAVGACVEREDGEFFDGCNIENASYGLTVCAERVAVFKAVSDTDGAASKRIVRIAIAGGPVGEEPNDYAYPCGACRQVLREFGTDQLQIFVVKSETDYKEFMLGELFPNSFGPDQLN